MSSPICFLGKYIHYYSIADKKRQVHKTLIKDFTNVLNKKYKGYLWKYNKKSKYETEILSIL